MPALLLRRAPAHPPQDGEEQREHETQSQGDQSQLAVRKLAEVATQADLRGLVVQHQLAVLASVVEQTQLLQVPLDVARELRQRRGVRHIRTIGNAVAE